MKQERCARAHFDSCMIPARSHRAEVFRAWIGDKHSEPHKTSWHSGSQRLLKGRYRRYIANLVCPLDEVRQT